jgi:menaquinone-specific isochorismate synthase
MTSTSATSTITATANGLVARTLALPAGSDLDLLAIGGGPGAFLWQTQDLALAGRGVALRVGGAAGQVAELLAAIPTEDEVGGPGCGPVVLGALPFDDRAATRLVIPASVVGRAADGRAWLTTVAPSGVAPTTPDERSTLPEISPPDRFSLVSARSHADWSQLVQEAVVAVRAGQLAKVVLAREVLVEANRPFVPADILRRLHALYPSCMLFAADGFLGASPELLVGRRGRQVRSQPLAGTVARSGDPRADDRLTAAMMTSAKERREHRLVVDEVAAGLRPVCEWLDVPDSPSIVPLRNVSHLGTPIAGRLTAPPPTALELVARLHPTPAVAGSPTRTAASYLKAVEGFDRGHYGGPVGWMDANGDGDWAVGIRCAEVAANTARLFAGVGVVADSDPDAELAETQLKLQALLAALVRP